MTSRRWAYYLLAGCLLGAAGIALGPGYRRLLTEVIGVAGVALTYLRARRLPKAQRRPWHALSLGGVFFLLGGVTRFLYGHWVGGGTTYPSPADLFFFLSYFCLIATVVLLVRLRSGSYRDSTMNLDAIIVAAGAAVAEWAIALAPYVRDHQVPAHQRAVTILYAVVMIVLAAATIRLSVGPGIRNPSFWLLAAGMGLTFIADVTANLATAGRADASISQSLGPFIFGFWVAAALHPDSHLLTERSVERDERLSWQRLLLLATALLIVPVLTVWQVRRLDGVDVPVIITGWVVLAGLVLVRLAELVRSKERAAHIEGILRQANAELATATSSDEMTGGALAAVEALIGKRRLFTSYVGMMRGSSMQVVRATGRGAHQLTGTVVDKADLPWPLRLVTNSPGSAHTDELSHVLTSSSESPPRYDEVTLVAPLVSHAEMRGAIVVTTPRPPSVDARRGVEQVASTLALALESATVTANLHRAQSERRFRALVENSSDIVVVADETGTLTFASPACRHILGRDADEVVGMRAIDLVHRDDRPRAARILAQAGSGDDEHLAPVELRIGHFNGGFRWFEVRARDLSSDPEVGGLVINAREITDRKAAEEEIARREARFRSLVQHSSDIVAVLDASSVITYVSPAVTDVLGYRPEELIGTSILDMLGTQDRHLVERRSQELLDESQETGRFSPTSLELQIRHKDRTSRFFDITITDLRGQEAVNGVVLNARDVTVRKVLEHDLRHQALHDPLTGLGNRTMFLRRVAEALDDPDPGRMVATLFVDLDDFKTVNDSLGHAVGDELLVKVAARINTCLHHDDAAARLGGDEFAILVQTPHGREEVTKLADRILTALRSPFTVQNRDFTLAASLGIAFEEVDSTGELLLRNADMAMYLAKERGKDRFEVFQQDMHASVFERLVLKADLARGIDSNQLRLSYQPIVSLQTGRITGVEALVRWDHPTRGPLLPAQFVALAEDTGLIVPLGRWVLEEACRQLRQWQLRLPPKASLTMSVNLSVRQLAPEDIVEQIAQTIHQFQIDPSTITMELTESMLMEDTALSRRRLNELKTLGVSLAIDDFGTGYSSLGYVQQYPIDIIKIDRSFVDGLSMRSGNETVVVQTMIEMAQRLGVHIVAEGIENVGQLRVLQTLGCDLGQGFYFSRPVEAHEIGPMLEASIEHGSEFLLNGGAATG